MKKREIETLKKLGGSDKLVGKLERREFRE